MPNMQRPLDLREAWLRHDRTFLNLYAQPLPAPLHPKSKNLWKEIQKFTERYIVDNHIPWDQYAPRKDCANTAFILGTSALNEKSQLISIYEQPGGKRRSHHNVFLFHAGEMESDRRGRLLKGELVVDRLDENAISVLDRKKVLTFGDNQILKNARDEDPEEIERVRRTIRTELVLQLTQRGGLTPTVASLRSQIQQSVGACRGDYRRSIEVARLCYARLLSSNANAIKNYRNKGSLNGFLDAGIIKDALFFEAKILTRDDGVKSMAKYCGIETVKELHA